MDNNKKKIVVGLSGGVDSASTVLLLQEEGYQVTGLYFDVTGHNQAGREGAEKVAEQLKIDLIYKDMSGPFEEIVIDNFCREYGRGRTPNPCVICNPNIKFPILAKEADRLGAHHIATGHYARCKYYRDKEAYLISMGANRRKDQSYMLYRLPQEILERLILPLGDTEDKKDVRKLAKSHNLSNANAKDSQEICFVDGDYQDYLYQRGFSGKPGNFIDKEGNVLGRHKGITSYTVGQRKGLGIALGKPAFVTRIDSKNNTITLGDWEELYTNIVVSEENFFPETGGNLLPPQWEGKEIHAKIRYSLLPQKGVIKSQGNQVQVEFVEKQRAATPGQSIVFYHDDCVVGGGFIK